MRQSGKQFGLRRALSSGSALAVLLFCCTAQAEVKPLEPPSIDYKKVCTKGLKNFKPTRMWKLGEPGIEKLKDKELYELGILYMEGNKDVPADIPAAARLFEELLKRNNPNFTPETQTHLGKMFLEGKRITQDTGRGLDLLQKAYAKNEGNAAYYLGHFYETDRNYAEAVKYFQQGIRFRNTASALELAALHFQKLVPFEEKTYQQAVILAQDLMLEKIALGYCSSFYQVGIIYYAGEAVPRDLERAARWFKAAAEAGEYKANLRLADMYRKGMGVPRSMDKAIANWKQAAAIGSEEAMHQLGMVYILGDSVEVDYDKGIEWLTKSAKRGYLDSEEVLARIYLGEYDKKEKNQEKALYWMEAAARQPRVKHELLARLANAYDHGYGTKRDTHKAFEVNNRATALGNMDAAEALGESYLFGRGTAQQPKRAQRFFRLAATRGSSTAMMQMAKNYDQGIGMTRDLDKSKLWMDRAIVENSATALLEKSEELRRLGGQHNMEEAVAYLQRAARSGSREAMVRLSVMNLKGEGMVQDKERAEEWLSKAVADGPEQDLGYLALSEACFIGEGIPKDEEKGLEFLKDAAELGNKTALYRLGKFYLEGIPKLLEKDYAKAHEYLKESAQQGYPEAMSYLGDMYLDGLGIPSDPEHGMDWLVRAAQHGSMRAGRRLGSLYEEGRFVKQNDANALAWYEWAAVLGDASSMVELGRANLRGIGTPKDPEKAQYWFARAAATGTPSAMREMGYAFLTGNGVKQDEKKAGEWFTSAAEAGDVKSMKELAQAYAAGYGVKESAEKSLFWWTKAAETGDEEARKYLESIQATGYGTAK